ncbi:caspase family protein, partial [Flavobacteriaceae bacterium]|nr:caspase family protein [Flavobacteriaceae bacterium]
MKNLLFYILFISVFSFSQEEKRLALVIGNSEYINGPLKNPVNDAKLIAKALDSLGFEVLEYYNLTTQRQLKKAILEFGAKRDSANVGFVYYAGHGVQVNNENYLLPTQEEYTSQTEVIEYAVSVQTVLRALKSDSNQVNILVLDACRDNPFESNWSQTRSAQGGTGGLAKIPPPNGSIIAFSTSAGETAADGKGINSDYTLSLYKNILLEDTSLDQVFRNIRAEVLKITNGAQRPLEMTQLTGQTFYLNPGNYDDEFKAIELILEQKKGLLDALNILAPIIDDKPENIRAQELLAESYVALEKFSRALETLDTLVGLDTEKSEYLRQRAWCYKKLDNLEKALEEYNKAAEVEPENSYNYEMRGDFYENYLKDYDKALADYNKGIELNPNDADLHFSKAYA